MAEQTTLSDFKLIRNILQVKLAAASALTKISKIQDLPTGWDNDDADLALLGIKTRLECEYTVAEFDAIENICEDMIHRPPSYEETNTGQRRHRAIELDVLLERARRVLARLHQTIAQVRESFSVEIDVIEAEQRVRDATLEIDDELKWDPLNLNGEDAARENVNGTMNGESVEHARQ